ncbi:25-hydroxycholesterol 7-alpha-hydroxylase-like protein [Emericellopsis cladophorae]|uniref:25-hydroxycholesterol 7-alpha-hydroxylase-like protein n=1 Tax=Emericellopsis cladophorae TaxID=2686198 RepID=A0A9P9Y008_9HYPO|nr:25-hydroxycholesterol 7-alpha-hydroxylase-like protein [Emericellopsis cladophorae]KAI6780781.1 25-hydroxycholesterol 7-alpha-hydroxylase-like protein [Emericellopsis cladophorae]
MAGQLEQLLAKAQQPTTVAVIVALLIVAITTRLFTGAPESGSKGAHTAAKPGYYAPFLGHVPQMSLNGDSFLAGLREKYPQGIVSLLFMGKTHSIVYKPSLATPLMNKPHSVADESFVSKRLCLTNFGFKKSDLDLFQVFWDEVGKAYNIMLSGEGLANLVETTATSLKSSIADFVTFNAYPSDQAEWERMAEADVVEHNGEQYVEAELMGLTKNFVAQTANPALMGTDFCKNFPEYPKYVWDFDAGFVLMAMGLPSWLPWWPLQRAQASKRRQLGCLDEYHEALDKWSKGEEPGHRWENLDDISILQKERVRIWEKHNVPVSVRAAADLGLVWAMNANSSPLVYWMLLHIYKDTVLLEQIREEIAPYIKGVQPTNLFGTGISIPPKLETFDIEGLTTKCPLLKSSYVETLRLYVSAWSIKYVLKDTTLGRGDDAYVLSEGTYAHAPHDLHQLDPKYFPEPHEWQPRRHVKEVMGEDGKITITADMGSIRPYGGGAYMCKGRAFAMRELMMYTAAIVTMYDIRRPEGQEWFVPKTTKQAASRHPTKEMKVWIKRRPQPDEE